MHHLQITAAASLALLIGACAPNVQYRTAIVYTDGKGAPCEFVNGQRTSEKQNGITNCVLEHRYYGYKNRDGSLTRTRRGDYYLAFVEFDDQGWFWDRKQMEGLLRLLFGRQKDGSVKDFLIFVHAHGWQHNAGACDNNVVCFQRLLERFDIMERSNEKPRKVIGVYVGWRGRSLTVPGIDNLSFWERKNTADRVGTGGVTELLSRLNDFRRYMNPKRSPDKTQMIISGHSFGGQVIYTALSHALIERAAFMEGDKKNGKDIEHITANSFGDLIVLVNPAFEGTMYEPLYHVATNRCYPSEQRPAMLVITSEADQATKKAFPLGRWFSTLFETTQSRKSQIEQKDTILETVGHLDRYRTHELKLTDEGYWKDRHQMKDEKCGCPYLNPTADFVLPSEEEEFYREIWKLPRKPYAVSPPMLTPGEKLGEVTYGKDLKLVPNGATQYAANFPYLVIKTGEKLIPDHNAIYGENFTDFLRRFYVRHIKFRVNFPRQCFPEDADGKERFVPACKPTVITAG
jgi:hypothetical protein